jgi:hypothetical protein
MREKYVNKVIFLLRWFGKVGITMGRFYNKITVIQMSIAQRDMMYEVNKVRQMSLLCHRQGSENSSAIPLVDGSVFRYQCPTLRNILSPI